MNTRVVGLQSNQKVGSHSLVSNFIETKYFYITNSAQLLSPFPSKPYVMIANGKHFKFIYTRKAHCQKHFFSFEVNHTNSNNKNSNANVHIFLTQSSRSALFSKHRPDTQSMHKVEIRKLIIEVPRKVSQISVISYAQQPTEKDVKGVP